MKSMNDVFSMVCLNISTQPGSAAGHIDRLQNMLNQYQEIIQQVLPRTYAYISKQENKDKLKAGGEACKTALNDLKTILLTDIQENKGSLELLKQIIG